jgi:hypothetical protein
MSIELSLIGSSTTCLEGRQVATQHSNSAERTSEPQKAKYLMSILRDEGPVNTALLSLSDVMTDASTYGGGQGRRHAKQRLADCPTKTHLEKAYHLPISKPTPPNDISCARIKCHTIQMSFPISCDTPP